MDQRFCRAGQYCTELQEQLSEANNKISRIFLEKAILSTQVWTLERELKKPKGKMTGSLSDEEKQVNIKLLHELGTIKQTMSTSQGHLEKITTEKVTKRITDLETERSKLLREKEELRKVNETQRDELMKMKEKCSQLRKSVELERLQLQSQCLLLEGEVREKEKKLRLQQEEHQKQDAVTLQMMQDVKSVPKYPPEKWESEEEEVEKLTMKNRARHEEDASANNAKTGSVASEIKMNEIAAQRDKEEIEKMLPLKANMETTLTRIKKDSEVLSLELDTFKRHLELQRCRKQGQLRTKDKGGEAQDPETMTGFSQSSLPLEPQSPCHNSQNKTPQVSGTDPVSVFTIHSLREQLQESTRRANQLEQEKRGAVRKLQTLRRLYLMPAMSARASSLKAANGTESCENGRGRTIQSIQDCPPVTEQPDEWNIVPNPPSCSGETDLQQKGSPSHFPDGLFRAELVEMCCSDAHEEEEDL